MLQKKPPLNKYSHNRSLTPSNYQFLRNFFFSKSYKNKKILINYELLLVPIALPNMYNGTFYYDRTFHHG